MTAPANTPDNTVHIIGAGLAGSEAAWQLASRGVRVVLHEMRPVRTTEAHVTDGCAELVCSNSFRSDDATTNAVGLLHAELRRLDSLIMRAADANKVPAGGALAVDRHALAATAFITAIATSSAEAHVSLATKETAANSSYKAVLQVPHGCDGEATVAVRVQIPEGVIGVKPMPKAGWTLTTTKGPYAKPYDSHGRSFSDGVKEIVWSGGNLSDDYFDEFVFQATIATDGGAAKIVYFPTSQQCVKGEAAWTEIPAAGQSVRDLKKPAPAVRISATTVAQAGGHDHGASAAASSDTFKVGDITVASPWTRATPGGAKVAGGYLNISNNGAAADKLVGGATDIAGRVEVHEMSMNNGVMQMRPLDAGLELKAGQTVELKPGGHHVMFLDLKRQLKEGDTVNATLQFEKAGKVDVTFKVGPVGGASAPHSHH
jgi:hypothetical protein